MRGSPWRAAVIGHAATARPNGALRIRSAEGRGTTAVHRNERSLDGADGVLIQREHPA
jgi:hypothetical protein